jgi:hypothetical protein
MRKIMKTKILMLFAIIGLFTSCEREDSADVNQDRIYTIYSLVYQADQDITYARAWFRFGSAVGTLLELSDPSNIKFEEQYLGFKELAAFYEKSMAGKVNSGSFVWEDIDGLVFTNSISIREVAFPANLEEINGDYAYELVWQGPALSENEYVAVAINGDFESDATLHFENKQGSTSITIPKTALEILPKNTAATFWLEFGVNPDMAETTGAGGEIYGKYRVSKQILIK